MFLLSNEISFVKKCLFKQKEYIYFWNDESSAEKCYEDHSIFWPIGKVHDECWRSHEPIEILREAQGRYGNWARAIWFIFFIYYIMFLCFNQNWDVLANRKRPWGKSKNQLAIETLLEAKIQVAL